MFEASDLRSDVSDVGSQIRRKFCLEILNFQHFGKMLAGQIIPVHPILENIRVYMMQT